MRVCLFGEISRTLAFHSKWCDLVFRNAGACFGRAWNGTISHVAYQRGTDTVMQALCGVSYRRRAWDETISHVTYQRENDNVMQALCGVSCCERVWDETVSHVTYQRESDTVMQALCEVSDRRRSQDESVAQDWKRDSHAIMSFRCVVS